MFILRFLIIRRVLQPQFVVVNAANQVEANEMFVLLVTVTVLENLETLDAAVDVFNADSVLG